MIDEYDFSDAVKNPYAKEIKEHMSINPSPSTYASKKMNASDPFYSASNLKHLENADQQVKEGHVVVKTMAELEKMENT